MSTIDLRNLTNNFQDVRLISLASWSRAAEIASADRGGPYMVTQEGYDPEDPTQTPTEFALGRSGKWLSLGYFFRMPVPDRRAEFIFATAAEVMQMMSGLPMKPVIVRPGAGEGETEPAVVGGEDEMAVAYRQGKSQAAAVPAPAPEKA